MIGRKPPNRPATRSEPPPRDPEIAVREEYELATSHGTVEALELFIRRHPEHPLAAAARHALARARSAQDQ